MAGLFVTGHQLPTPWRIRVLPLAGVLGVLFSFFSTVASIAKEIR